MGDKISIVLPDDLKEEIDKLRELYKEDQSSFKENYYGKASLKKS